MAVALSSVLRSKSCGIIVVGDEILKGFTRDTNSSFLCSRLFKLGIKLDKISTVPDVVKVVAAEVREFSRRFDYVITSGGVGPTHDDITYEAVAQAFEEPLCLNAEIASVLEKFFGQQSEDRRSAAMKMARVPQSAQLLYGKSKSGEKTFYPVVRVRNVTIFPGVPRLLTKAFRMLEDEYFRDANFQFYSAVHFVSIDEVELAHSLSKLAEKYEGRVNIGSYPQLDNSAAFYKVKIALDSTNAIDVENASSEFLQSIPSNCIVHFDPSPTENAHVKLEAYVRQLESASSQDDNRQLALAIHSAIATITEAVEKFGTDATCISFNGGKDCTVLLHLLHCVLLKQSVAMKFKALYIHYSDPFFELESFVEDSTERYNIRIMEFRGDPRVALAQVKEEHPEICAILMGTRRSDPHSNSLQHMTPTDPGWPSFMRVLPLLDWSYAQIWRFLRDLYLPYCQLYDYGYTSIGGRSNTSKNASLMYTDKFNLVRYNPAYLLKEQDSERSGRINNTYVPI